MMERTTKSYVKHSGLATPTAENIKTQRKYAFRAEGSRAQSYNENLTYGGCLALKVEAPSLRFESACGTAADGGHAGCGHISMEQAGMASDLR